MTMTARPARNGVDVPTVFATLDAVRDTPEIAQFQFRATNRWVGGTHSRSTIHDFHGAMQEMTHPEAAHVRRRPPRGARRRRPRTDARRVPAPRARLRASPPASPTSPPARGVDIDEVSSTVEGDIDLMGLLGLDPTVRNGFQKVSVKLASARRRPGGAATRGRAVVCPLGGARRHDQRCAGVDRGRRRLRPARHRRVPCAGLWRRRTEHISSRPAPCTTLPPRRPGHRPTHGPAPRPAHDVVVVGARRRRLDRHAPRPRRTVGAAGRPRPTGYRHPVDARADARWRGPARPVGSP